VTEVRASLRPGAFSPTARRKNPPLRTLFLCLLILLASISGCKKRESAPPTPAKIHSISNELAAAARSAAPAGTLVRIVRPIADKQPRTVDSLEIKLPQDRPESAARADVATIQRALGAVATRNGLTEEPSESREGVLFYYLKGGSRTHAVHIHFGPRASAQVGSGAASQNGPELAIILDDLGNDRAAAQEIFALPYPVTVSILPNHEYSREIAQEALRRGYQVMLHLPMQAVATEKPEAQELRSGMSANQVAQLVDEFLQNVPGVVGVNNHQGSQATSDPALMGELMPVLRDRQLFYIDSRTTSATVAYDMAQSYGVPSFFRNVPFLDDVVEIGAVRKQLELALQGAREKGTAATIGHPHPATLQALRGFQRSAQAQGVQLVFVSELVH
jgi:uncharacterized protein